MKQGLNSIYYAGKRVFKFIVPLNAFITVWCTEAGSMWGIKRSKQCTETGIEWLSHDLFWNSLRANKQLSLWNITGCQTASNRIQKLIIKRNILFRKTRVLTTGILETNCKIWRAESYRGVGDGEPKLHMTSFWWREILRA